MKLNHLLGLAVMLLLSISEGLAQDLNQPTWTSTGSLNSARIGHTATLLPDGRVLITAGWNGSDELASSELFIPKEGTFTQAANLNTGRTFHTATLLPDGRVLVVGGQFHGKTLASAEIYNPVANTWTGTGSLHIARSYHTATLLNNGQVLVVGGTHWASLPVYSPGVPPDSALDVAELYNPTTGKWTVTDSLHTARYVHTATLLNNGQVLVTGGLSGKGGADVLASAELYDPETKNWKETVSLPHEVFNHTATLLPNGKVLVVGGQYHGNMLDSVTLYDPAAGAWTTMQSLHTSRNGHSATLLSDGDVLVAGGAHDPDVLKSAELYKVSTGTWEEQPDLNEYHCLQTATCLPNGQVLIVGGVYKLGLPSFAANSAEIYVPATPENRIAARVDELGKSMAKLSDKGSSKLLALATCLVVITTCTVILTACVVILLCAGMAFMLIRRWSK